MINYNILAIISHKICYQNHKNKSHSYLLVIDNLDMELYSRIIHFRRELVKALYVKGEYSVELVRPVCSIIRHFVNMDNNGELLYSLFMPIIKKFTN